MANVNHHWYGKKHTQETKDKISKALTGMKHKPMSNETKKKIGKASGDRKHTEETKRKIGARHKGKVVTEETRKKMSIARKGMVLSAKTRKNISIGHKGCKNGNWRGGVMLIHHKIRASDKAKVWRQQILMRDSFTCRKCGSGENLRAHHIKSFNKLLDEVREYLPLFNLYDGAMAYTPLWDINNGITLCQKCHKKQHYFKRGESRCKKII